MSESDERYKEKRRRKKKKSDERNAATGSGGDAASRGDIDIDLGGAARDSRFPTTWPAPSSRRPTRACTVKSGARTRDARRERRS